MVEMMSPRSVEPTKKLVSNRWLGVQSIFVCQANRPHDRKRSASNKSCCYLCGGLGTQVYQS